MTPINDPHQRLTYLETRLMRLEAQESSRITLAQQGKPRDVRLSRTVQIPDGTPTYPLRTNPDDSDSIPRVFPFRFIDADFVAGEVNATAATLDNRTTDDEDLTWGYSVSGLYLPLGYVSGVIWQRGQRDDVPAEGETPGTEYGEWWLLGPGENFVRCVTTAQHLKGSTQNVYVADDSDTATTEVFKAKNKFRTLASGKFAIAAQIGRQYYLVAGDC